MRLATPILIEESLTLLVGMTDWWLTGQYIEGTAPKAAMGLMSYIMWMLPSLFAAIAIGATALIARSIGAGNVSEANRCANQSFVLGSCIAIVSTAALAMLHSQFVSLMGLEKAAAEYADQYLQIVIAVIPFMMLQQIGAACLRGAGDTFSGSIAKATVVIVNLIVSSGLVTGWWIFPKLGFVGIAYGTAAGYLVGGSIIAGILFFGRAGLRLKLSFLKPNVSIFLRLLKIGIPGGVDVAAVLFCQFVFIRIVFELGEGAAAAHGLTIQIEAMAYLPATAFQVAVATMAGQFLGANDKQRAIQSVKNCCGFGCLLISMVGVLFYLYGEQLAGFFAGKTDIATAQLSAELLRIISISMPALALVIICSGALRGAGDTAWPMSITFFGFLLFRIPLALYFRFSDDSIFGFGNRIARLGNSGSMVCNGNRSVCAQHATFCKAYPRRMVESESIMEGRRFS